MLTSRDLIHNTTKSMIGVKHWAKLKSNAQTLSSRSFVVLMKKAEKNLVLLYRDEYNFKKNLKFFLEDVTQRAYSFGLRSSGVGISIALNSFQRKTILPKIEEVDHSWLAPLNKERSLAYRDISRGILFDRAKNIVLTIIDKYYKLGKIAGSPPYSLVYFYGEFSTEDKIRNFFIENSPWPKEKVSYIPDNIEVKVVPKPVTEYNIVLNNFLEDEEVSKTLALFQYS